MRKYFFGLSFLLLAQSGLCANYYEVTPQEIKKLWSSVSEGKHVWEEPLFSKVIFGGVSYWLAKPALKGVYPAMWKRWAVEEKEGAHVKMEGWYAGDENTFLKFFSADLSPGDVPVKKIHNKSLNIPDTQTSGLGAR